MSLSWRDAVATLLVGVAGVVTYAKLKDFEWPFIGSWRAAIVTLFVIGIGTCIVVGPSEPPVRDPWIITGTVLGVVALALAAVGLFVNNKTVFLALAADIFLLWLVSSIHHLVVKGV